MAEIVAEPADTSTDLGFLGEIWYLIVHYWWVLLLVAVSVALFIFLIHMWKSKEENDRKRDSAVYATAMNLRNSCEINRKDAWIRTRYSLWNLLWLGIPFIRREHSVKLVDIDRNVLGWYRGHAKTQDGDEVYLMYKQKIFLGLFEDKFLLYCPKGYRVPRMEEDKKTKEKSVKRDDKGNIVYEYVPLPENLIYFDKNAQEIIIKCNTITKQGNYYHVPSYVIVTPDGNKHVDLTHDLATFITKVNFVVSLENAYADMSRSMGRAAELNPWLRHEQKAPEKEKVIEDGNKNPVG